MYLQYFRNGIFWTILWSINIAGAGQEFTVQTSLTLNSQSLPASAYWVLG